MNKKFYEWCFEVLRAGNRAVKNAQAENRKKGIPNVYSRNGKHYYELPDGTITNVEPAFFSQPVKTKATRK